MKQVDRDKEDKTIRAARALAEAHDPDPEHAFQVCRNSLALFDALSDLHRLGGPERRLLEAAALVHDIGYESRPLQHHKGSRDLILDSGLEGLSRRELTIVACVARYHRKVNPKPDHAVYRDLDKRGQAVVKKLAAILRVADGLDRTHAASVVRLRVNHKRDTLRVEVIQRTPSPEDIDAGMRKGDLFERVFGVKLEVAAVRRSGGGSRMNVPEE